MANSPALADVIDLAINEHLWDGTSPERSSDNYDMSSCGAVFLAHRAQRYTIDWPARFFKSLGVDWFSHTAFDEFEYGPKRQYARALWLTWAAMIAREEGL